MDTDIPGGDQDLLNASFVAGEPPSVPVIPKGDPQLQDGGPPLPTKKSADEEKLTPDPTPTETKPDPTAAVEGPKTLVEVQAEEKAAEQAEREVKDRRLREVTLVGGSIVEQSIHEYKKQIKGMDADAQIKYFSENPRAAAARTIDIVMNRGDGNFVHEPDKPIGNEFGSPIALNHGGQDLQIASVLRISGDEFICTTVNGSKVTIQRGELAQATIASEVNNLMEGRNSAQRKILEIYVLSQSPEGQELPLGDELDQTLPEAARSMGMITSSSLSSFIEQSGLPEAMRTRLQKTLENSTVVRPEIAAAILHSLDPTPKKIADLTQLKDNLSREVKIQEKLYTEGKTSEQQLKQYQERLRHTELEIELYKSYPKSESAVTEIIGKVYSGEISIANPARLDQAIQDNDIDAFFDELIDESELEGEEIEKFKKLKAAAKILGIGGIAILVLILMSAGGAGGGR